MSRWHETLAAGIGLRLGGVAILSAAWLTGSALYARVHMHPPAPASPAELALCALLVLLLVTGNALLFVGPGLWKQVEIPARWSAVLTGPREFDIFHDPQLFPEEDRVPDRKKNAVLYLHERTAA